VKTVLFSPDDVDLISGPPSARRRYLDIAISQASRPYLRALSRYTKVLEQRNSLLRVFSRERLTASSPRQGEELAFWDSEFVAAAADVLAARLGAVKALSERAKAHIADLAGTNSLSISYVQHRLEENDPDIMPVEWRSPQQALRQSFAASLASALSVWRSEELRRGVTAIGPHRDDFIVKMDEIDLGRFGSRGQQRLAVIALKLAELDLLNEAAGEPPILLLDDVLSELDASHRSKIVATLASRDSQICVTATDMHDLGTSALGDLPLWNAVPGAIETGETL
jgi:DNA replication and repair protein RecF